MGIASISETVVRYTHMASVHYSIKVNGKFKDNVSYSTNNQFLSAFFII